jgi:hypothetical protein
MQDKLKKGPVFKGAIENTILRKALIEEITELTIPVGESRLYPFIIGERGTGKTSLIKLAVDRMDEPKGVVYVDFDIDGNSEIDIVEAMRVAMGWRPDTVIDSSERNYNNSLLVNIT